jgi:MerR family transcriptional regulator/heat shock protein HspR
MRERMEEMNRQMQGFVDYVRTEMLARMQQQQPQAGLVPMPRPAIIPQRAAGKAAALKGTVLSGKSAGKTAKGK